MEQIDARHFAIHLSEPLTLTNAIIMQHMQVLPAHYWRERDPSKVSLSLPLSSGPYRVSAVSQARYVEYERVPDHWGRNTLTHSGVKKDYRFVQRRGLWQSPVDDTL